jgi:surface carbohydrate biosynthesis protein
LPVNANQRLLIPVETLSRELDAKLLLACFAATQGYSVMLGSKRVLHQRIERLPRSIYLGKSLSSRNIGIYSRLRRLGFTVATTDEEGIVYYSPAQYRQNKLCAETMALADVLLAWGEENEKLWKGYEHYKGTPIHITGNPRVDLLRPELRGYWSGDVKELQTRFGRYILLNSNFGKVNHFRTDRAEQLHAYRAAMDIPEAARDFDTALAVFRFNLFENFKEMAKAVARACPHHTLVIRPHPSESHTAWRAATAGHANVQVLHEGNIIPWLLGADAVIHNGCTTGIEAYVLGTPVFAYRPVSDERFDLELPNNLSHEAYDLDSLIQALQDTFASGCSQKHDGTGSQQRLIKRYIAALDGTLASQRIVSVFNGLAAEPPREREYSATEYCKLLATGIYTRTRYRLKPWGKGRHKRERYTYQEHIFPDIPVSYIDSRIQRLRHIFEQFHNIRVKKVRRKVFSLESRSG